MSVDINMFYCTIFCNSILSQRTWVLSAGKFPHIIVVGFELETYVSFSFKRRGLVVHEEFVPWIKHLPLACFFKAYDLE